MVAFGRYEFQDAMVALAAMMGPVRQQDEGRDGVRLWHGLVL